MATTPENSQQEQDDFAAAFNGEQATRPEMSEDEAFGLSEEPGPNESEVQEADGGADEATESAQESDAESAADGQAGDDEQGAAPSVVIAVTPDEVPADPKDAQRAKSWEGRLKAREEELKAREDQLKAREAAMGEPAEPGETAAQESAEAPAVEAMEDAMEKVDNGELTFEQAMATLSSDFGPDFTKMLSVIAKHIGGQVSDERVGPVNEKLDGIVGEIVDDKARAHFESIADSHPDFMDVAKSPEFKEFIDGMDEAQKAGAMQTIETGSARQIIKLLNDYKAAGKTDEQPADEEAAPAEVDQGAMDAAEGVRSGGLKLPEKPAIAQDYEDAWNQF